MYMQGQKSYTKPHGGGWFSWELKFLGLFLGLVSFFNLVFIHNVSALFIPTLSASVDQANLQVNGNQVIKSTTQTTELPLNFTVNTNNRTGYTATISAETNNTSLSNSASSTGAKISSISSSAELNDLPNNTWGYKFGGTSNYAPIPALSSPAQILQTAGKTNGNESNQLSIGMKLSDNLESGNYTNKLILSFVSNPYQMRAVMTTGQDFNTRVGGLDQNQTFEHGIGKKENIKHIKYSLIAPTPVNNAINIEDADSDYEIKAWFSSVDNTLYYNTLAPKIFLNPNSANMFLYFTGVIDIDLSHLDSSEVTDMHSMFFNMKALKELDLSHFDTRKNTNLASFFGGDVSLQKINLTNFNTENVTDMRVMFYDLNSLQTLDVSSFNTNKVTMMDSMFYGLSSIRKLDLSNFDTSQVISMPTMFAENVLLNDLNLSSFNTSRVENMSSMFMNCKSLTALNLNHFNTEKVRYMASMFNGMFNLASLNISNFNTENVENMSGMFSQVQKLEHLNLSHFRTDKVTNMGSMFYQMIELKTIDLSHFNTANVTDMSSMFSMDDNLTELDLRSFTTPKVENFGYMFASFTTDNRLTRIYTSGDWDISRAVAAGVVAPKNVLVFANRVNLVGNNGWSSSTPNNVGLEALRIDRPGAPGYFTFRP